MSAEANKAAVRRFHEEAVNGRSPDALDELCLSDVHVHHPPSPGPTDLATGKQLLVMFLAAFPDVRNTIDEMVAEGDRVVTRGTMRGTHRGELMGMPSTGREVTMGWISFDRFVDGRFAERWVVQDNLGLLQQLGAIPAAEPAD